MRVKRVAETWVNLGTLEEEVGYEYHDDDTTNADELAEAAGRLCYLSFNRPNPATSENKDYLNNILTQQHYSVMEHSSVTYYVDGVSRSLLTELERHRHLSFSVVSQRYVDESEAEAILPPALDSGHHTYAEEHFDGVVRSARRAYKEIYSALKSQGLTTKQAREAARSVLPNATETKFFVTGNLRTWREILQKRRSVFADAEIQQLAEMILEDLKLYAPNTFQDFE